jgi:hypothetical protein
MGRKSSEAFHRIVKWIYPLKLLLTMKVAHPVKGLFSCDGLKPELGKLQRAGLIFNYIILITDDKCF